MSSSDTTYQPGTVGAALAERELLGKKIVAARVDGLVLDLQTQLGEFESIEPVKFDDDDGISVIRHSAAHVMADAVQRLFPGTQVAIGPSIETGFYYDFDRPAGGFNEEELAQIEAEMQKIIQENVPFVREVVERQVAFDLFKGLGENYKLEILETIDADEPVTLYRHGDWEDL